MLQNDLFWLQWERWSAKLQCGRDSIIQMPREISNWDNFGSYYEIFGQQRKPPIYSCIHWTNIYWASTIHQAPLWVVEIQQWGWRADENPHPDVSILVCLTYYRVNIWQTKVSCSAYVQVCLLGFQSTSPTPSFTLHSQEGLASTDVGFLYGFSNFGITVLDGYVKSLVKLCWPLGAVLVSP